MSKHEILQTITFGHRVAEEETDILGAYFVETDHWRRLYRGDIDVVYGPKGSGKSALYALLISRSTDLFDRRILLTAAENPRGATAFRDLIVDPPVTEREFIGLWKLYLASLLHGVLKEYGISDESSETLEIALAREGLVKGERSLASLLQSVLRYVRSLRLGGIEGGLELDPVTQLPKGFKGKITFSEPPARNVSMKVRQIRFAFSDSPV
jgi:hypothetical protein